MSDSEKMLMSEEDGNSHAGKRQECRVEKSDSRKKDSLVHTPDRTGRVKIDRHGSHHVFSIVPPKKISQDWDECSTTAQKIRQRALKNVLASF